MEGSPLGVILTGGKGTRLRPLTPAIPKALIPLLNRPLLAYSLDLCARLGLAESVVVVGGDHGVAAEVAARLAPPGLAVTIAEQAEPLGTADALAAAGDALDGRNVVVVTVDTLIRGDLRPALAEFQRSGALAGLILHPTDRPREMGIAVLEGDRVAHLEEKPQQPRSELAVVGVWMLAPEAVERVNARPAIDAKGERNLTATIGALAAEGADVRGWRLDGEWLDAGSIATLLSTQSRLLAALSPTGVAASDSALSGVVAAGAGTTVATSKVEGPVLLGENVIVDGCELGPDVVVGDGARLRSVQLRGALVVPGARLDETSGSGVVVTASGKVADAGGEPADG